MAGGRVHIVMAGNPTTPSGAFYDAFGCERSMWNCITLDAFQTPNLEGVTLEQLLAMDVRANGPLDDNSIPYLVTRRWVRDSHRIWWHGDEPSSPSWVSRVRGEFPSQSTNSLFRLAWLERCKRRSLIHPTEYTGGSLVAGVDVGGGDAETVVYVCEITEERRLKIIKWGAWRGEDTRGVVVWFLEQYRERLKIVRVDAIGIGANFGLLYVVRAFRTSSRWN